MISPLLIRRLRLVSGLVLFTYLLTHFLNHTLGLISLDSMEDGLEWFLLFWRNPLATAALYGALIVHALLAFWALYGRSHLRMPAWEATQLALGLAIPPLLASHILGTRVAASLFELSDSYARIVVALWYAAPPHGVRQAVLLIVAWVHGCIGLHFWLRLRPWYRRIVPVCFAFALLLPVLALLGFASAGREVTRMAQTPGWLDGIPKASQGERATLTRINERFLQGYAAALAVVLVARAIRLRLQRRRMIRVGYPAGRAVSAPAGFTVLEVSRLGGIPHASVCGGRGRCSTCRVRIMHGHETLPKASVEEQRVLDRVGAPPSVRLACQLRPTRDLAVAPVLPAQAGPRDAAGRSDHRGGREQEIAVLFADLRGFTSFAEQRLPYDVVFVLNRYCEAVGGAITRAGGVVNQFSGDGVMALFGVDTEPGAACRTALAAATGIIAGLDALNGELSAELPTPLRMGIGIHAGPAIVGRMGYGDSAYLTAVGDTVNVAARLEQLTKDYRCQLVISEQVAAHAGLDVSAFPRHEITVRNRAGVLAIRVVENVSRLGAT